MHEILAYSTIKMYICSLNSDIIENRADMDSMYLTE